MSYLERTAPQRSLHHVFGYQFQKQPEGWRWVTYDSMGGVAESGVAQSRAEAAAFVIRARARE